MIRVAVLDDHAALRAGLGLDYVLDIAAGLTATALGFMAGRQPARVARARARSLSAG